MIAYGMTPGELVKNVVEQPPRWLTSEFTKLALLALGIVFMAASVRLNVWSRKQRVINQLAEDLGWAIHNLLNRPRPLPESNLAPTDWKAFSQTLRIDFDAWCAQVSAKLGNEAFFTRADQLHFDRLGFVPTVWITGHPETDHVLSMLSLKFDRLREILNLVQQRPPR